MGDEGNESHEEGYEGHEGNESNEGNEEGHEEACHEEGGRGGGPDEEARNEGHERGDEGDESNEGNEGHEEVIAHCGPRRRSAEMISHGGVPRRALFTVPVLENIQSSALCDTK